MQGHPGSWLHGKCDHNQLPAVDPFDVGVSNGQDDWGYTPMQWAQARDQWCCTATLSALSAAHVGSMDGAASSGVAGQQSMQPSTFPAVNLLSMPHSPDNSMTPAGNNDCP